MKATFDEMYLSELETRIPTGGKSSRSGVLRTYRVQAEDGFTCKHCKWFVSSAIGLAGVLNRNHCPYCLWSRHLDLYRAGDRLCACKGLMRPVGLAHKRSRKKYTHSGLGELMLIHACTGCGRISINRLAADDDPDAVLRVFDRSLKLELALREQLTAERIEPLQAHDRQKVHVQLLGCRSASD